MLKTLFGVLVLTSMAVSQSYNVDPCDPSPCGPNTDCSVNSGGAAVCRCRPGHFPKPDTITGCGPQCSYDGDCSYRERCFHNKCSSPCYPSPCGVNAECEVSNHQAVCKCRKGTQGDPLRQCAHPPPEARRIISNPPVLAIRAADPCEGNPCGVNAQCRSSNDRAVCSCLPGHFGDPRSGCRRGECERNSDCPHNRVCESYHCTNPCSSTCGHGADCEVRNHVAICTCPSGWTGNPFSNCRRYDENELCNPTPCGANTKCRVDGGRAICSCQPGYVGNAISGCRHECEHNSECSHDQACQDFKCKNPCNAPNVCGQYATCQTKNHFAVCTCPSDYLGNAYIRCFPECTVHEDCPAHRACIGNKCGDPCEGVCGRGAECRVDRNSHKAICSCPRGFLGHPFEECRPSTPADLCNPSPCGLNAQCQPGRDSAGRERPVCTCLRGFVGNALTSCQRGECQVDSDCGPQRNCVNFACVNPCASACGINAQCEVRNYQAVCSCPRGYTGNPFTQCNSDPTRGKK